MKKFLLGTLFLMIAVVFIAFNLKPSIKAQSDPTLSENYLKDKGYDIVEYKGRTTIMYPETDISLSDIYRLSLIMADYKSLLNQELEIDTYWVTNHPLDNNLNRFINTIQMGFKVRYPNMTKVYVVIVDNKIVGGFSNIYSTGQKLLGSTPYDIDGNSIESETRITPKLHDKTKETTMILKIIFMALACVYAALMFLAGSVQFKKKDVSATPSILMITGSILILISVVLLSIHSVSSIIALIAGLIIIHISAIMNGLQLHGKLTVKHHMIRFGVSLALVLTALFSI